MLVLFALAAFSSATPAKECRCVPPSPCWSKVPWSSLNASVKGRLHRSVDELAACMPAEGGSIKSAACSSALDSTDDEFWLADQPNGYQHTGLVRIVALRCACPDPNKTDFVSETVQRMEYIV